MPVMILWEKLVDTVAERDQPSEMRALQPAPGTLVVPSILGPGQTAVSAGLECCEVRWRVTVSEVGKGLVLHLWQIRGGQRCRVGKQEQLLFIVSEPQL